jgi:hypothetical protein
MKAKSLQERLDADAKIRAELQKEYQKLTGE